MYPSASHIQILDPASIFICALMAAAFLSYVASCAIIALYHIVECAIHNYRDMTFHRLPVVEDDQTKALMIADYGPKTKKYVYHEVA